MADEQAEVRKAAQDALAAAYNVQPSARKAVDLAAGYADFSNFGMKSSPGALENGVTVDSKNMAAAYMKMAKVQTGLGVGVKKFQLIRVFETEKPLKGVVE